MTMDDREPGGDDVLREVLRDAAGEPPFDDVDWQALHGRIRDEAEPMLARRRRAGRPPHPRPHRARRRRRAPRRWLAAVPLAAATTAAFLLFAADDDGIRAPSPDTADAAAPTAEDVLLADLSEDELRRRVTGFDEPIAWLDMAVTEHGR